MSSDAYKQNFSVVKRLYDERTEMSQGDQKEVLVNDAELFKPDYLDTTFDRIDKELSKQKKSKSNR